MKKSVFKSGLVAAIAVVMMRLYNNSKRTNRKHKVHLTVRMTQTQPCTH